MQSGSVAAQPQGAADLGTVVLRASVAFAKRNYLAFGFWGLGLLVMAFGRGLPVSRQQRAEFTRLMADVDMPALQKLEVAHFEADYNYRHHKGWFSCNDECQHWAAKRDETQHYLVSEQKKAEGQVREAHRALGLFSEDTVTDVRGMFWQAFAGGKRMAKRSTYWDVVFMGVRLAMGRDESIVEFLLRILMRVVMNLTIGLLFALVSFMASLGSFLYTYAPDPVSGLLFFALAALAAASVVASYLFVVYIAAAGTVVGAAQFSSQRMRGLPGSANAFIHNGRLHRGPYQRPHYD